MSDVRLGLIGAAGSMAGHHLDYVDEVPDCKLAALCDVDEKGLARVKEKHDLPTFTDAKAMIDSGEVDAILIATPHYFHPTYAQYAFERGIHVLTEKPVAVTAKAAQESNEAYEAALKKHPKLIYAAMFNQRNNPEWREIHRMTHDGSVGNLIRVSWTITNWFRSQAYYNSGGWRATWAGEGGGVLINQCPHNLDLFQWFVGMPSKVTATAGLGKFHDIEVEDDIVAMLEFENGATGTFITSTGQTPGVNRLEIVGDNGTIIFDDQGLRYWKNAQPASEFCHTTDQRFGNVPVTKFNITPPKNKMSAHRMITTNFIAAIAKGEKLIAPATEGIHGLELGNAMLMSGITGQPVNVPTDREAFDQLIQKLIKESTFEKKTVESSGPVEMGSSF